MKVTIVNESGQALSYDKTVTVQGDPTTVKATLKEKEMLEGEELFLGKDEITVLSQDDINTFEGTLDFDLVMDKEQLIITIHGIS